MIKTQVPEEFQGSTCFSVMPGYQPTRDFEKFSRTEEPQESKVERASRTV